MTKTIRIFLLSILLLGPICQHVIAAPTKSAANKSQMQFNKINLNTASQEQLSELPGVGKKKAAAIVEYRTKNGDFTSVDDLVNVKGIGNKILNKLRDQITLK